MNNDKKIDNKQGMKILNVIILIWTITSIVLAGILNIRYANYILLGTWMLVVIICFIIDMYIKKKYIKDN